MADEHSLQWRPEALTQINDPILAALEGPEFVHYAESKNPEIGMWGLAEWEAAVDSLPDRVEKITVTFLQMNPRSTLQNLEMAVNNELPGLLTPSLGLLRAVLTSYAVESEGTWNLRPEDSPATRRVDLETAAQALTALGRRLGVMLQQMEDPYRLILWQESGKTLYAFYLLASAVAGKILRKNPYPPDRSLLVLPGGRAGLLAYKLDRDPGLRSAAEGWRIVKFRALRRLTILTSLTRERFEKELGGDPIESPEQMKLF